MGEIPRYEVPEYEQKEVITPERETQLAPIDEAQVLDTGGAILGRYQEFQRETVGNEALSWDERFKKMKAIANEQLRAGGEKLSEQEEEMIMAFWGMGEILAQVRHRNQLDIELEDIDLQEEPDYARRDEITKEMDYLNIDSAEWQASVMKILLSFRETPAGRDFIGKFWQSFEELSDQYYLEGKTDARKLRNGILGAVTAIDILESLGVQTYFAHPDQDAVQKIDLWGQMNGQILAFQIKSHHAKGDLRVYGEEVTGTESTRELKGIDRRDARARKKLFTSAQKYANLWQVPFIGTVWVDLDHYGGTKIRQDESTGTPQLPPDLPGSVLAQVLAKVVAKGGENVRH